MKKHIAVASILFGLILTSTQKADAQTVNVPQSSQASWRGGSIDNYYRYVGPDLDIQGGVGYNWNTTHADQNDILGFVRVREGVLWVPHWPWAFAAGMTVEANNLPSFQGTRGTISIGGQFEAIHIGSGLWFRAGTSVDGQARPHFNAAVGQSLFGIELQTVNAGPNGYDNNVAVLGTLRIPLGFVFYVIEKSK